MELTPAQRAVREEVREVAAAELRPVAADCDREGRFPEDAWDELAAMDLTAMTVPEAHGGLDVDRRTYALVNEELGWGMLAAATALSVHCLATSCIAAFADEALQDAWLPEMADGRPVGAFALSEPDAGSNPREMTTVARRDGDGYVMDGRKQWITNGQRAGVYVVFAKTDPEDPDSITQFLVPGDADGLTATEPLDKLGLRASDTTGLELDGVEVPADHRLTPEGEGLAAALSILTGGRIGIAAQAVGLARAALEAATEYATEREQFDGPIADVQTIRHDLAEMWTTVRAGRLLTHDAARRLESGADARAAASMAKRFATEGAMDVTERAVQIHGGYGYTTEFPVERYYRDAKVTTIYEGTTQIQADVVAREWLDRQS